MWPVLEMLLYSEPCRTNTPRYKNYWPLQFARVCMDPYLSLGSLISSVALEMLLTPFNTLVESDKVEWLNFPTSKQCKDHRAKNVHA